MVFFGPVSSHQDVGVDAIAIGIFLMTGTEPAQGPQKRIGSDKGGVHPFYLIAYLQSFLQSLHVAVSTADTGGNA